MAGSQCTSCGLVRRRCQCSRQTSTSTDSDEPTEITPACCCANYLCITLFLLAILLISVLIAKLFVGIDSCYLELFADTVSVSNANANARVSAAEWRIGFVARSPVTGCKISLRPIKSRLLRGDEVIAKSSSPSMDPFGQVVTGDETNVVFETVVAMPEVIGDVIWDIRVEIIAGVKTGIEYGNGFLLVFCGDIPVNFTADPAGNMIGSLLGNMRRCDYLYRDNLNPYLESLRS